MQETLNRYLSYLQQDSQNVNLLLEISSLYAELDALDKAQEYLSQAKKLDYTLCLVPQGLLYLKQNQLNAAQKNLKEALHYEDTPDIHYALALSYYLDNQFDSALDILSSIQDAEYSSLAVLLNARILCEQENMETAIALLEQHCQQVPQDAEALGLLSLLYFDNDNEQLAQELCTRSLQLDSSVYDARVVDILLRLPNKEVSSEEIKNLLAINPEDTRLLFALGSAYMTEGEFILAETYLLDAVAKHPNFYDCYIALAWCQLLADKVAEAHETYQNALGVADYLADAWGGLAIIYGLTQQLERAEQMISKAQLLNPECFLTEIAEIIYLTHKEPEKTQKELVQSLTNQQTMVSTQLALIIEQLYK